MSQHWYASTPHPDNQYDTDLNNVRAMFETLRTSFSGSSAPSNASEGMLWRDTNKAVWKARAASAWRGLMHGDVNQKIYVYRNNALEGWVIDTAVADTVLAFKGGSTYANGGALAGSWAISGLTAATGHTHSISSDGAHSHTAGQTVSSGGLDFGDSRAVNSAGSHAHGGSTGAAGASTPVSSSAEWRPRAAVGTLQRLDV